MMDLQILEIKSPGAFWAREIPGPGMSQEMQHFQRMDQEIQNFCESSQFVDFHVLTPQKGKMYLAKRLEEHGPHWYRCIVKTVLRTSSGPKASCHLVDRAITIQAGHNQMREIPDKFKSVPHQVREFKLHGIQPLTMHVSFLEGAEMKPSVRWDTAAVEYFEAFVKGKAVQCEVKDTDQSNVKQVTLFTKEQGELINVNELLVKKGFAKMCNGDAEVSQRSHLSTPLANQKTDSSQEDAFSGETVWSGKNSLCASDDNGSEKDFSPDSTNKGSSLSQSHSPETSPMMLKKQVSPASAFENLLSQLSSHKPESSHHIKARDDKALERSADEARVDAHLTTPRTKPQVKENRVSQSPEILSPQSHPKVISPESSARKIEMLLQKATRAPLLSPGEVNTERTSMQGVSEGISQSSESLKTTGDSSSTLTQEWSPKGTSTTPSSSTARPSLSPLERLQHLRKSLEGSDKKDEVLSSLSNIGFVGMGSSSGSPDTSKKDTVNISEKSDGSASDTTPSKQISNERQALPSGSEEGYSSLDDTLPRKPFPPDEKTAKSLKQQRTPFLLSSIKIQDSLAKQLMNAQEEKLPAAPTIPQSTLKRILIHGERPPKLIPHVNNSPFPQKLKQFISQLGYPGLTLIQSACWAAISRGRDIVGVAPKDQNHSLAYLAPVISQMMQSSYNDLPAGHGPIFLVISSAWQRALSVYQQVLCLNGNNTTGRLKAILLHGAGSENEQQIQLLNGAPIVVGTLPCVLRLVESDHVNLNRLFHLVIDNADIMFEQHLQAVKELMVKFRTVLRVNSKRNSLRQLMVFSSKWTIAMRSYMKTYLSDPLVIVTDSTEMAVYSRVPQKVVLTHPSKRVNSLLEKLNSGLSESHKIMVFTSTKETARDLRKILKCSSYFTLLAAGEMLAHQLEDLRHEWQTGHRSDSQPILVVSDDCAEDLELQDASCIIHYDLPTSKVKYGKRMACLKDKFVCQIEKPTIPSCQTILFVTPESNHNLYSLLHVMKRSGQPLPEDISMNKALQYRDKRRSGRPLCHSIKLFGFCRQESSCSGRHLIQTDDQPGASSHYMTLPQRGQVKILVMHVIDATSFYARIIRYQPSVQEGTIPVTQLGGHPQLNVQLSLWFSDREKCAGVVSPSVGKLYAIQDSKKSVHRVLFEQWAKPQEHSEDRHVQVKFVDEGKSEILPSYKLMALPAAFKSIPYQAVEIVACGVMPPDKENSWTTQANLKIHNSIHGLELEGKVVLSLGNTMWLDPVVQRIKLPDLKGTVHFCNVRRDLIENDFGVSNPSHIERIKNLCAGIVDLEAEGPNVKLSEENQTEEPGASYVPQYDSFTVGESYEVYLSASGNPHLFSVQKTDVSDRLEKLLDEINNDEMDTGQETSADMEWSVDDHCLAKFPCDDRWYRGKIAELGENLEVVFVDFGDQESVPRGELQKMPRNLLKIPFAAIDCAIPYVTPVEKEDAWTAAGDHLWDSCNIGATKKILTVKVLSDEKNLEAGGGDRRYSVELFIFQDGKNVAASHMLWKENLVVLDKTKAAEVIIPVADMKGEEKVVEVMTTVCKQCQKIYLSEGTDTITRLSEELYQQILEVQKLPEICNISDCIGDTVLAVCRLLNHHEALPDKCRVLIAEGLLILVNNDWNNARIVANEGCIPSILLTLQQIVDSTIRHKIFWLLNFYPTKKLLSYQETVGMMFDVFTTVPTPEIQICCLTLLLKLWQREDIKALLPVKETVVAICNVLWGSPEEMMICEAAKMLHALSEEEEAVTAMRREKLGSCIECLLASESLSVSGEAYMILLTLSDMFDLETYSDSNQTSNGSDSEVFEVVRVIPFVKSKELNNHDNDDDDDDEGTSVDGPMDLKLVPSKIKEEEAVTKPRDEGYIADDTVPHCSPPPLIDGDIEIFHPRVCWSQRSNCVMVSVQLHGVQSYILEVTSLSLKFSCNLEDRLYEFEYELCNRVNPDNYISQIFRDEVLITLYKEGVGINWPRLISSKVKVPLLSIDFRRWREEDEFDYDAEASSVTESMSGERKQVSEVDLKNATIPELEKSSGSSEEEDDYDDSSGWSDSDSSGFGIGCDYMSVPNALPSDED
ncbi:DEAD-box ATP-dependent RNA helicase 20 [Holothuria leucospilota]|uniref:RNA helicase n=1 Tax=Holothuria leucospilota TaxID=206669 RepID=A0A9Q1CAN0_HOLLE|nr:DEAD-box ATP-dependent RNA helicase 20 [Holothuria leucospilota]